MLPYVAHRAATHENGRGNIASRAIDRSEQPPAFKLRLIRRLFCTTNPTGRVATTDTKSSQNDTKLYEPKKLFSCLFRYFRVPCGFGLEEDG